MFISSFCFQGGGRKLRKSRQQRFCFFVLVPRPKPRPRPKPGPVPKPPSPGGKGISFVFLSLFSPSFLVNKCIVIIYLLMASICALYHSQCSYSKMLTVLLLARRNRFIYLTYRIKDWTCQLFLT